MFHTKAELISAAIDLAVMGEQPPEILRAAALTDEEVRATYQHHDELRRTAFRQVIEILATKGRLRDGLTVETATDLFMTLLGDAFYDQLTVERDWTHDLLLNWLTETLPRVLLDA